MPYLALSCQQHGYTQAVSTQGHDPVWNETLIIPVTIQPIAEDIVPLKTHRSFQRPKRSSEALLINIQGEFYLVNLKCTTLLNPHFFIPLSFKKKRANSITLLPPPLEKWQSKGPTYKSVVVSGSLEF